jgi:hypothetical protein
VATETLAPDAVLDSTNYSAAALADVDEDPDSPDGNWWTWDGAGDTIARLSFPTPTGNPTTGAGQQEFRAWVRKSAGGGGATPVALQLYENGSKVGSDLDNQNTAPGGTLLVGTWDAADLGTADGSLVEVRIEQTGNGASRGVELGAVEWNVVYDGPGSPMHHYRRMRGN